MFEQSSRPLKVALSVLCVALLAVLTLVILGENGLLGKKALAPQPTATTSQSQPQTAQPSPKNVPNLTGADEGTPTLDKEGFTEFVAANIDGAVTEIDKANSFLRIYDTQRGFVYTVFVPPATTFIEKERTVSFTDIRLGDAIRATSNTSQNAFEFHADSVTIVSHQADQPPILPSVQKIPL